MEIQFFLSVVDFKSDLWNLTLTKHQGLVFGLKLARYFIQTEVMKTAHVPEITSGRHFELKRTPGYNAWARFTLQIDRPLADGELPF